MPPPSELGRTLVLSCAALAGDIRAVTATPGWDHIDFEYLPANYHNRPEKIVPAVQEVLETRGQDYERVLIGYGDCGTGGHLDRLLQHHPKAERLPGDHCYAFFSGLDEWLAEFEGELGTYFVTDYLVRHQDALIFGALGLNDHPELRDMYFGNYTRVLWISQAPTPELEEAAQRCANRLNLRLDRSNVGRGLLESRILELKGTAA